MSSLRIVVKDAHNCGLDRNQDTGRQPLMLLNPGFCAAFASLPVGATFRMYAGKWVMRKLTATTAARVGRQALDLAHEFEGDERCVITVEED